MKISAKKFMDLWHSGNVDDLKNYNVRKKNITTLGSIITFDDHQIDEQVVMGPYLNIKAHLTLGKKFNSQNEIVIMGHCQDITIHGNIEKLIFSNGSSARNLNISGYVKSIAILSNSNINRISVSGRLNEFTNHGFIRDFRFAVYSRQADPPILPS